MSLIFDQAILDLDTHGVLALALGSSVDPPLPAQAYGFATWHDTKGSPAADRLALCTRPVAAADLRDAVSKRQGQMRHAVASVSGRLEWLAAQVTDNYLEAPSAAFAMADGCVLLLFSAMAPHAFRLVDVPRAQVLWEETVADLRQRLQITVPAYMEQFAMNAPVVYASGARHLVIYLGDTCHLLQIDKAGAVKVDSPLMRHWAECDAALTKTSLLMCERETARVHIARWDGQSPGVVYDSALRKKGMSQLASGPGADRFALSHPGGSIEIVDCAGVQQMVLRPYARASGKDCVAVHLSAAGRYLLVDDGNSPALIDLQEMRAARVALPDGSVDIDRMRFSPTVVYRSQWASTERGGYVLENRVLTHTAHDALHWQPFASEGVGKPAARKTAKSRLPPLLAQWKRPAATLVPARPAMAGRSKLYGLPCLPPGSAWPLHAGRPMLLLCQIDLAELAGVLPDGRLPQQGGLLFFVAVDGEGEPALDDAFNPVAVRVMWLPELGAIPTVHDTPQGNVEVPEQALHFQASGSDMPQPDAAIVTAARLSDDDFERYRVQYEKVAPGGAEAGHRLGGYPHLLQSNSLELQAQQASSAAHGVGVHDTTSASAWQLLLQLDSDDVFMWGTDSGMLYFMVHEDDVARTDFSRVVALTEGC